MKDPSAADAAGLDARRLAALAGELGLTPAELEAARAGITPGLEKIVLGALVRFEDALFEMSQ